MRTLVIQTRCGLVLAVVGQNAAVREMRATGFIHNYMGMYWGKKILEWSADPEAAFRTVLHLNNRYFLDGRDANSYANVA